MKKYEHNLPFILILLTCTTVAAQQWTGPTNNQISTAHEALVPVMLISNELRVPNTFSAVDPSIGTWDNSGYGININKTGGIGFALNGAHKMVFKPDGNVGMGTTNPIYELSIHDSGTGNVDTRIHLTNTDTGSNWSDGLQIIQNGAANLKKANFLLREDAPMAFWTNNLERVTIANNGYVGVGTTSPVAKLVVKNSSNIGGKWNPSGSIFATEEGGNSLIIDTNELYSSGILYLGSKSTGDIIRFRTVSDTGFDDKVVIKANGNLGIGTTTPDAKLTVKGQVHALEVKVDLDGALAPDYVFYEDYDLLSLDEVQKYIDENGHLPNIPSAAEIEKDGLHLKEMNLKLLEKVEELTLYVLQLNEENKALEAELSKLTLLEKRLQEIEKNSKE